MDSYMTVAQRITKDKEKQILKNLVWLYENKMSHLYYTLGNFLWSTIITHIKYVPDLFDIIVNKAACYYLIYI